MRNILILTLLWVMQSVALAGEMQEFDSWIIQGAKIQEQIKTPVTITSEDKTSVQKISTGMGQFISDKPFHEVVAFYVHKSELKPPNWSILGRQYPGTQIFIPAHFSHTNFYREKPSVSLLHNIQEEIAVVHLLITDHPVLGFLSITISRGKNDTQTLIQMIQHPSEVIKRN